MRKTTTTVTQTISAAIGTLALLGGMSAAFAADLPRKSVPVQADFQRPPIFTWTGFYVGVNGGYDFSTGTSRVTGTPAFLATGFAPLGKAKTTGNGFTGGGTLGYNYQIGNIVTGIEADLNYLGVGKRVASTTGPLTTTLSQDPTYLGTARVRLGYAYDRLLVYGTGGLAYGNTKNSLNITGLASTWNGVKNDTRLGWTAGAGAEYALSTNWSVKAEYLYYNLGKTNVNAPLVAGVGAGVGVSGVSRAENRGNIVRAGVNYRF
jgi:outer membrane immunogenic protein